MANIWNIVGMTIMAVVICRCNLLDGSFAIGVSFISYMVSRNTLNLYLIIPVALGLIPYATHGWDIWPYVAAMAICGIVLALLKKLELKKWQQSVIAATSSIVTMNIYRLINGSVYMTSFERLLMEGLIIIAGVYLFDTFFSVTKGKNNSRIRSEVSLISCIVVCLMAVNGAGLSFLVWMVIVYFTLWALSCIDTGQTLLVIIAGGTAAALMGHANWGIMTTIMLGAASSVLIHTSNTTIKTIIFVAVCLFAETIESGVVLGIDERCLFISAAVFATTYWKFGKSMRCVAYKAAGRKDSEREIKEKYVQSVLKDVSCSMNALAELYSTYIDSRLNFANQFEMTKQIIEAVREKMNCDFKKRGSHKEMKYDVDIAISQCAAGGRINGDCCGWQKSEEGKIFMAVSDGMGKGKKAAAESLLVIKTMLSLLKSGVKTDLALKMINTIMLTKESEDTYATLDLVILDCEKGKAKFYKTGAAPTLIRRKANVEEVKLSAVPLGIVNGLKIHYVETVLKRGDWIIMMSDGVSDGGDGRRYGGKINNSNSGFIDTIKETAAGIRSVDPQTMSDLILNRAADSYAGMERDDLTVMVARIL